MLRGFATEAVLITDNIRANELGLMTRDLEKPEENNTLVTV